MKTIKQIADELGVSKQAVRKQVDKLPPTCISTGKNQTILIDSGGQAILRSIIPVKVSTEVSTNIPHNDHRTILEMQHKIEKLELEKELQGKGFSEQIEILTRENQRKDAIINEQIKSLREITAALVIAQQSAHDAQKLHAGTIYNQKQLTGFTLEQDEDILPVGEKQTSTEEPQNLSFWGKVMQHFK